MSGPYIDATEGEKDKRSDIFGRGPYRLAAKLV